jgi:hypothetical protein
LYFLINSLTLFSFLPILSNHWLILSWQRWRTSSGGAASARPVSSVHKWNNNMSAAFGDQINNFPLSIPLELELLDLPSSPLQPRWHDNHGTHPTNGTNQSTLPSIIPFLPSTPILGADDCVDARVPPPIPSLPIVTQMPSPPIVPAIVVATIATSPTSSIHVATSVKSRLSSEKKNKDCSKKTVLSPPTNDLSTPNVSLLDGLQRTTTACGICHSHKVKCDGIPTLFSLLFFPLSHFTPVCI